MSSMENRSAALWTRGMIAVLSAQFLSAMADNALLFGALALLKSEHYPDWAAPLLQEFFVGAFILLAPFAIYLFQLIALNGMFVTVTGRKTLWKDRRV